MPNALASLINDGIEFVIGGVLGPSGELVEMTHVLAVAPGAVLASRGVLKEPRRLDIHTFVVLQPAPDKMLDGKSLIRRKVLDAMPHLPRVARANHNRNRITAESRSSGTVRRWRRRARRLRSRGPDQIS